MSLPRKNSPGRPLGSVSDTRREDGLATVAVAPVPVEL